MSAQSAIDQFALPAAVTILGIYQLSVRFVTAVVKSRQKFKVQVPDTNGPPEFIRTYRAHQNTLEFYPVSVVCLWIASLFFHPVPASVAYLGFLIGRERYFWGYIETADKRIPGFKFSIKCLIGLFAMCIFGVVHKFVRYYGGIDIWLKIISNGSFSESDL
ncbi:unnamed protein product [Lymnaea stagnalis]|uniref:Microsomal glutathione S-transferase 2 n=1 Tax=Lymnaea stagnalis TaxID=6523 RepID=A0AAV2HL82_LYMST